MLEKKLLLGIKIAIYLSFVMPLIVMGETFIFPFVFPKAIYFRILAEIIFGLFVLLCVLNRDYRPRKTPIMLAIGCLLLVQFLSAVFGVDFQRSMWGNHERMSGWFTLIHFGLYFVVVSSVLKKWEDWLPFLRWSLAVSLVVGLTGVGFLLADNSIMKIGEGGTLGNKIYLANFVLFHIFIAWLLFRKERIRSWKIFSVAIGVIEILIMIFNGKRGPFLGLLAGAFIGILLYSIFAKAKRWRLIGLSIIVVSLLFVGVVFFNKTSSWVGKIPMIGNLAAVSFDSGTGATRLIAWKIAYQSWRERPLLGWGVENFYYVFNKFYNPESLEHGYYETWFDRSHNIFLDYLSTGGILSLMAYLGLFVIAFGQLFGVYHRQRINKDMVVFFSAFLVAYALQNLFVFDNLSSYLTFYLLLAMLSSLVVDAWPAEGANKMPPKKNEMPLGLVAIVVLVTVFFIYKTNVLPALANNRSMKAQTKMSQDFPAGIELYKLALSTYTPHLSDLRNDLARIVISFSQSPEAAKSEVYKQAVKWVIEEQKKNIAEYPLEINSLLLLGQSYSVLGENQKAAEMFRRAQELSPKRQQVAYLLTRALFSLRDFDGAIAVLNKTVADDPKVADSYWYLALVYNDTGRINEAYFNLKEALARGKTFENGGELAFVGFLFRRMSDLPQAIAYYEKALIKVPNDSGLLLALSELYSQVGDVEKAREMADRAALYDATAREKARAWLK